MLICLFHKCRLVDFIIFTYIDPGSGSILLQFLIASVVGAVFYFRKFVTSLFRTMRGKFFRKLK